MNDSVTQVIANVVRNRNGRNLLYQCRPAITSRRAVSQHILNHHFLTIQDILQQRQKRKQMIFTVLGVK